MTSEIAIMNKEAIALAADSAVTQEQEGGRKKVFTSANKLFALSKYHPVGIMIYGSATLMDVPWETIIKIYRSKLGKRTFETLKDYADDFIAFLDNGNPLFPEDHQEKYLSATITGYFRFIRQNLQEEIASVVKEEAAITHTEIKQIASDTIKEHYDKLEQIETLPSIPENYAQDILGKYGDIIDQARKDIFEELPISPKSLKQLTKISTNLLSKDIFPSGISGIVIAGFGEADTFPCVESFDMHFVANNKLRYRYRENISGKVSFENNATIIPYAQRNEVVAFMEGIHPSLLDATETYLSEIFNTYPEMIVDNIENLGDAEKCSLKRKLKEVSTGIFQDHQERMQRYRKERFINPVMSIVAMLPKDELAAMAETLVNLTSFKLRVGTMETETVAGPIDVAVISKGDGFIWIKRKHYFKAELNPRDGSFDCDK